MGITTTTENGEKDEVGEVVEELCWDREGGKAGGERRCEEDGMERWR